MEILGILIGLSIASKIPSTEVTIYSDCQSAVKKLHKLQYRLTGIRLKSAGASLHAAAVSHWNKIDEVNLQWVKGRPEKVVPDALLWTREMWGNHLSDRAAAGPLNCSSTYQYRNLSSNLLFLTPTVPLDAPSLSQHLVPDNDWYYGNNK